MRRRGFLTMLAGVAAFVVAPKSEPPKKLKRKEPYGVHAYSIVLPPPYGTSTVYRPPQGKRIFMADGGSVEIN